MSHDVAQLRSEVRGRLIERSDAGYAEACKVYNGMISKRPLLIVQCQDAADVIAVVKYARNAGLPVSVRGGGHNAAGLGVCDDGVVIDLSPIKFAHVSASERTVRVGGGSTWGEVDHATHAFGLAIPSGFISTTGVGGLTLGGGIGYLSRQFGLTIDNLLSADLVLADGRFVVASADENPDLYWAIRGGGGNFGVATSFLFRAHPVDIVCAGPMLWHLADAPAVMKWYREFIRSAPAEINGFFAFLTVPPVPSFPERLHLEKMCGIVWCYNGPLERANQILDPLRKYKTPAFEHFGPMPFPVLQSLFDGLYPAGLQWYWKSDFVNELSDEAISEHLRNAEKLPSVHSTMHLYPINGAVHKVGATDTPWSYRNSMWSEVIVGVDPDPGNRDSITQWSKSYWEALHPHCAKGTYVNFMMEETPDRIRAAYGANYDRLAQIKAQYDPSNFFRVNQNIPPASTG